MNRVTTGYSHLHQTSTTRHTAATINTQVTADSNKPACKILTQQERRVLFGTQKWTTHRPVLWDLIHNRSAWHQQARHRRVLLSPDTERCISWQAQEGKPPSSQIQETVQPFRYKNDQQGLTLWRIDSHVFPSVCSSVCRGLCQH